MTEWWLLIVVFWVSYIVDALRYSARPVFAFTTDLGRRLRATHGHWPRLAWSPWGWSARTEDLPVALAPEGLSDLPAGSLGRPAPEPDGMPRAWSWDQLTSARSHRGAIWVGEQRVCAATPALDAGELKRLASELAPLAIGARAPRIEAWTRSRLATTRLRRRLSQFHGRTRLLSELVTAYTLVGLLVSAYLMAGGSEWVGKAYASRIAASAPMIGAEIALLHVVTLVVAWRAHRRLFPNKNDDRFSLIVGAAFFPPHVLRLRSQLAARLELPSFPLALTLASSPEPDRAGALREVIADLRWPLTSRQSLPKAEAITAWWRVHLRRIVEAMAATEGLPIDALLAPPAPDCTASCLYCPRCGDQFVRGDAVCPRGITLQPLLGDATSEAPPKRTPLPH